MKELSLGETYKRSYIAIPITESPLFEWVQGINGHKKFYHITILFLGDLKEEQLLETRGAVSSALENVNHLPIYPEKLGFIGQNKDIFVLKILKTEELLKVKRALDESLFGGQFDTKYFLPHITIERARTGEFNKHEKDKLMKIYDRSDFFDPYNPNSIGVYYKTEEGATALLFNKKL
jgi:2'-5' RNA ligase